jgi:hypothetical protein
VHTLPLRIGLSGNWLGKKTGKERTFGGDTTPPLL